MAADIYIEWLRKEFLGELSASEAEALRSWENQNPENMQIAKDLRDLWKASTQEVPSFRIDREEDYAKVRRRIDAERKGKSILLLYVSGIAASFLILLGIGLWWIPGAEVTWVAESHDQEYVLPDNSLVRLSQGSKVSHKKNFLNDRFLQFEGEGFFDIQHQSENPFRIQGFNVTVEVLGTTFYLKDLAEADSTELQLIKGSVSIQRKGSLADTLTPGQSISYSATETILDTNLKTARFDWANQGLTASDEDIVQLASRIGSYYGIEIKVSPNLNNCRFSGSLPNIGIEAMLDVIVEVYGAEWDHVDGVYALIGGGCK